MDLRGRERHARRPEVELRGPGAVGRVAVAVVVGGQPRGPGLRGVTADESRPDPARTAPPRADPTRLRAPTLGRSWAARGHGHGRCQARGGRPHRKLGRRGRAGPRLGRAGAARERSRLWRRRGPCGRGGRVRVGREGPRVGGGLGRRTSRPSSAVLARALTRRRKDPAPLVSRPVALSAKARRGPYGPVDTHASGVGRKYLRPGPRRVWGVPPGSHVSPGSTQKCVGER